MVSRLGAPTSNRGARSKSYSPVSGSGLKAVRREQNWHQSLLKGLDLLGGTHAEVVAVGNVAVTVDVC